MHNNDTDNMQKDALFNLRILMTSHHRAICELARLGHKYKRK